jgi:hypothetical protein
MTANDTIHEELRALRPPSGWASSESGERVLARVVDTPTAPRPASRGRGSRRWVPVLSAVVAAGLVAGAAVVWLSDARPLYGTPQIAATPAPSVSIPASKLRPYPGPTPNPFADPDSPDRVVYDTDLYSDPLPSPAPTVRLTAAQAVAIAAKHGVGPGQGQGPVATLRMVTVNTTGSTPAPAAWPGWVLSWRLENQEMTYNMPAATTKERQEQLRRMAQQRGTCVVVFAINADTGRGTNSLDRICEVNPKR